MIKKYDVFDVYQDGSETWRGIAISDNDGKYVQVIAIDDFEYLESRVLSVGVNTVHIKNEIESILFNLKG